MPWLAHVTALNLGHFSAFNNVIAWCQSKGRKGQTKASHGDMQDCFIIRR